MMRNLKDYGKRLVRRSAEYRRYQRRVSRQHGLDQGRVSFQKTVDADFDSIPRC
jgi:hypothetical protein